MNDCQGMSSVQSVEVIQIVLVLWFTNFLVGIEVNEVEVHSLADPEGLISGCMRATLNSDKVLPLWPREDIVFVGIKCFVHAGSDLFVWSQGS